MRNVVVAWNRFDSQQFENLIPLRFMGTRSARLDFKAKIDLLFLDGLDLLQGEYRRTLEELGYEIHDLTGGFLRLSEKYTTLDMFGEYEKRCFLRWLLISEYFPGESIIHYDADMVLNEDPVVLCEKVRGKTFVLQGCPALTCISDANWFSEYKNHLDQFAGDIDGYSRDAWSEREGWERSEQDKWAGQRDRTIIASDQDLISHLIHTDRLPQSKPSEVLACLNGYILFENPLYIHAYNPWCAALPFRYKRVHGIDYINEERVAVWHMQSDFCNYIGKYWNSNQLRKLLKVRLPNDLEFKDILVPRSAAHSSLQSGNHNRSNSETLNLVFRILNKIKGRQSRLKIYQEVFDKNDFGPLLNDMVWWKEGVFE